MTLATGFDPGKLITFTRGEKVFELSNQLGNSLSRTCGILVTISDRKILVKTGSGSESNGGCDAGTAAEELTLTERGTATSLVAKNRIRLLPGFSSGSGDSFTAYIDNSRPGCELADNPTANPDQYYYIADVISASDYYPFGMQMPYRHFTHGNDVYRYGFNGKENDNEVKGEGGQQDYGMRIYDPRLGKFLSVDPLTKSFPMLTPYQFSSNRPIDGIDLDGEEHEHYTIKWADKTKPAVVVNHTIGEKETSFLYFWKVKVDHVVFVEYPSGQLGDRSFTLRGPDITIFNNWLSNPSNYQNSDGTSKDLGQLFESDAAKDLRAVNTALAIGAGMIQGTSLRAPRNTSSSINKQVTSANNGSPEAAAANTSSSQKVRGTNVNSPETSPVSTKPNNNGKIYVTPGTDTKSGKPYVGRTMQKSPASRGSVDGRNRKNAKVVDTYDPTNPGEGAYKEQLQIDKNGGLPNLDNKRNEVNPERMKELEKRHGYGL